ncbi:hypothetical protein ABT160_09090 [Streptomyces sp. NPDC001941]|uniref:lectin-like domain-containing protein n=1 Tax=Streptomyces sp. NPDC001941 TaxID=3154659 RepID=UPI0033338646
MKDTGHSRGWRAGLRARASAPLGLATAVALGLSLAAPMAAAASPVGDGPQPKGDIAVEAFTGATVDETKWFSASDGPNDPTGWGCLTAATGTPKPLGACRGGAVGDKAGDGALRLTDNGTNQNGFVVTRQAIPSNQGLKFTIDFAAYNSSTMDKGDADGISLMLLDGSAPMPSKSGRYGGGLGYTGIEGGYIGVGLDEWGNFGTTGFGAGGSSTRQENSITVRGATSQGNPLVNTYQSNRRLSVPTAKTRKEAVRTARVELSPAGVLTVSVDFHDGRGFKDVIEPTDIRSIKGQPAVPATVRLGLSAGTGDYTNIHELWNGKVETLDPHLSTNVTPDGPVTAGGNANFTVTTTNDKNAGPTNGTVTTTHTFPEGVTPVAASGDGWKCSIVKQTVTCTRPGSGSDALGPDKSYPPVHIKTKVDGDAEGVKPIQSTTETPNDTPRESTDLVEVTPAKAPDLTVTTKPVGDVVGGQNAAFTIDVANNKDAGPTQGEVKVVRTFPEGITPVTAVGDGWKCAIAGQTVTCTRPGKGADALNPGDSYPTINVGTTVDDKAKGPLTGTTQVTTPKNNAAPVKDTVTVKPAPVKDPNLTVSVRPEGDVVAGKPATFNITVSNKEGAGPTRDEVTVVRTFPKGVTPKTAAGDGWKCSINGQVVTCTRPGKGADALDGGKSFPVIKVVTAVDRNVEGPVEGTTVVDTPGDPNSGTPVKDTTIVKKDPNQDISCGGWIRAQC